MIFLNPSLRQQGGFFLVLFGDIHEKEIIFIASSEERNESLLSFRPSDDATKV